MEIRQLRDEDESEWEAFVKDSNASTFYHQIGWKRVIERTYGHRPFYLIARDYDKVVGILPLFLVKSRFFGTNLVSNAHAPLGGICASGENAAKALENAAITLGRELNVGYVELRNRAASASAPADLTFVTSRLSLDPDPATVFANLNHNKRRNLTKVLKKELSEDWECNSKVFYALYSQNMRDLGTPCHSPRFFDSILAEFPNNSMMITVKRDKIPIYSALLLTRRDTVIDFMSSTLRQYRKYEAPDFGIWKAMVYACQNGFKYFDFGRSIKGSSNHEFKSRWGAQTEQLCYNFYLNKATRLPYLNPQNSRFSIAIKLWRRLPLAVANRLGPKICKDLV